MTDNQNIFSWKAVSNNLQVCKKSAPCHLSTRNNAPVWMALFSVASHYKKQHCS